MASRPETRSWISTPASWSSSRDRKASQSSCRNGTDVWGSAAVVPLTSVRIATRLCRLTCGADQLEGLGSIEPAVVERAARDRAHELAGARLEQRLDVGERRKPARSNNRDADRLGERDGGVEVQALEQPVARDVGIDDGRDAGILELARDVERGELRDIGPALHRHLAVAGIERDRDPVGELARGIADQGGIAHRRGADDDAVDTLVEPGFDGS